MKQVLDRGWVPREEPWPPPRVGEESGHAYQPAIDVRLMVRQQKRVPAVIHVHASCHRGAVKKEEINREAHGCNVGD